MGKAQFVNHQFFSADCHLLIASCSIHPPTRTAAILLFAFIFGRTKIAVLVKVIRGILVVLLHVDLEFSSGAATFPAVITIRESIRYF
jgi:hypothetical protein